MAVEGHELPDELAAILDRDAHAVVDELKHLGALRHRHCGDSEPFSPPRPRVLDFVEILLGRDH